MSEQAAWALARADMYRFLSAAFLEPPGETLIRTLADAPFIGRLEQLFGAAAVEDLRRFVEGSGAVRATVDQEFQDLFMVPLGRYVTPYEAVYRDQRVVGDTVVNGLLMGPSTLAVKELYRQAGASIADDCKELPDHVGVELACMEYLCTQEARALEADKSVNVTGTRKLQKLLLEEHLLQWVPALCAAVREKAIGPLYRGIAGLTEAYLRREAEGLAT